MKLRKTICLMVACCLLSGCGKKKDDTSTVSDASVTEAVTTTDEGSENTQTVIQNTDIPEDAVLKVTETTYRNDEVWETLVGYRNAHDDNVAWGYVSSDGEETLISHHECKYDDNGKKIYDKSISDTGEYNETEYHDNVEKTKSYDGTGRLESESEATFDEYGNHIMSHTIIYDQEGAVSLDMLEDYSDCDYGENGKILVCRERSESGEIISTTTNTYDDNSNMLSSEKVYADSEQSGYYSIFYSYEYDDKNNLISEEVITKTDADTVYRTEKRQYQYDENGRKIRQDCNVVGINSDMDISEYTIYEYIQLK